MTFDQLPQEFAQFKQELRAEIAEIKRMISGQPEANTMPQWLNVSDLVEYLPSKPAKQTIYGLVNTKKIPCHRINGRLFFDRAEIDDWVEAKRKPTQGEIEGQADRFLRKGGQK